MLPAFVSTQDRLKGVSVHASVGTMIEEARSEAPTKLKTLTSREIASKLLAPRLKTLTSREIASIPTEG